MRKISNLLNHEGRVYIYLKSRNIGNLFRRNAEQEGFTFCGIDSDLYLLKENWTLIGAGYVGHILFHNPPMNFADGTPVIRVDYGKYLSGAKDYFYKKCSM